jgi:hypothetical protein
MQQLRPQLRNDLPKLGRAFHDVSAHEKFVDFIQIVCLDFVASCMSSGAEALMKKGSQSSFSLFDGFRHRLKVAFGPHHGFRFSCCPDFPIPGRFRMLAPPHGDVEVASVKFRIF